MFEIPSSPSIAGPDFLCTETFVQFGPFETEIEAVRCLNYSKTRFFRMLVSLAKLDQGAGQRVYRFVPDFDFSITSEVKLDKQKTDVDVQPLQTLPPIIINWDKPINDIDDQLIKAYSLEKYKERIFSIIPEAN